MAYICTKGVACGQCDHYRWDAEREEYVCWAKEDEENPKGFSSSPPMVPISHIVPFTPVLTDDVRKAEQVLIDSGIEKDKASNVLQTIGYALLNVELYR